MKINQAMPEITKERAVKMHALKPQWKCFAHKSGIQDKKKDGSRSFDVRFLETIGPIFKTMTGLSLFPNKKEGNYYRIISNDNEYEAIKNWIEAQGHRVFNRDCLSASIALCHNMIVKDDKLEFTEIGDLENKAKNKQDKEAVQKLAAFAIAAIQDLPFYKDVDLICAVPPSPDKPPFDLPSEIVKIVAQKTGKTDITTGFIFGQNKESKIKELAYDQKWDEWEKTGLVYNNKVLITKKSVILIDDKYQSGSTISFVASRLQKAGASHVYGLSIVKTLSNDDNVK